MSASGGATSIAPSLGVGNPFGVSDADVNEPLPSSAQACGIEGEGSEAAVGQVKARKLENWGSRGFS
jgi:hypothetical protein